MRSIPLKLTLLTVVCIGLGYSYVSFSQSTKTIKDKSKEGQVQQDPSQKVIKSNSDQAGESQQSLQSQAREQSGSSGDNTSSHWMVKSYGPEHLFVTPNEVKWTKAPLLLPKGAEISVLEGDPKGVGAFTIRLKFPAGYTLPVHWSPGDERMTVLSGSVMLEILQQNASLDPKGGKMPAGSFVVFPAKMQYQLSFKEETIIQLAGLGPWEIFYLNPSDDPRQTYTNE